MIASKFSPWLDNRTDFPCQNLSESRWMHMGGRQFCETQTPPHTNNSCQPLAKPFWPKLRRRSLCSCEDLERPAGLDWLWWFRGWAKVLWFPVWLCGDRWRLKMERRELPRPQAVLCFDRNWDHNFRARACLWMNRESNWMIRIKFMNTCQDHSNVQAQQQVRYDPGCRQSSHWWSSQIPSYLRCPSNFSTNCMSSWGFRSRAEEENSRNFTKCTKIFSRLTIIGGFR